MIALTIHKNKWNWFLIAPFDNLYAASIITPIDAYLKPLIISYIHGIDKFGTVKPSINITKADGILKYRNATNPPKQLCVRFAPTAITIWVEVGPGKV